MELSLSGDEVAVELLPASPHPDSPPFLQSIDFVASFLKKNFENPVPYDQDEMISKLLNAYSGLVFAPGGMLTVDFKGDKLKLTVASLGILELADEQKGGRRSNARHIEMGVMMQKTDITIIKEGGSAMKIKASAKRYVLMFNECLPLIQFLEPRRTRLLHPTSNSKIWVSEASTRSLMTSSVVPLHRACSPQSLSKSSAFST